MMTPVRIAATSYLNTIPFIYGIKSAFTAPYELLLSPPKDCAQTFKSNLAYIALVPIAALGSLEDCKIITPYCLGASSSVRTVALMSSTPAENIKRISLDNESLTSVNLVKILCQHLWHISPEYCCDKDADAHLFIGDKVFEHEGKYPYSYDLADAWRSLYSLPFVFAVWVAREGVSPQTIENLSSALSFGLKNIDKAINHFGHEGKPYSLEYLTKNIDYIFDDDKRKALKLFSFRSSEANPPSI